MSPRLLGELVRGGGLGVQLAGLDGEDVSVSAVVLADVPGGAVQLLLGLHHKGHSALGRHGPVPRATHTHVHRGGKEKSLSI